MKTLKTSYEVLSLVFVVFFFGIAGCGSGSENNQVGMKETKSTHDAIQSMQCYIPGSAWFFCGTGGSVPVIIEEDTDEDGLTDNLEVFLGTSFTTWDSDGDGMSDGCEVYGNTPDCPYSAQVWYSGQGTPDPAGWLTDPRAGSGYDTDNGGVNDGTEAIYGSDPRVGHESDDPIPALPETIDIQPGDGLVSVVWTATDGAIEYEVEWTVNGDVNTFITPDLTHMIDGLTNDIEVQVRLRAHNMYGWGHYSSPIVVTPFTAAISTWISSSVDGEGNELPPAGIELSTSPEATFTFGGSPDGGILGYDCRLDTEAFSPCNSGTITYTGLSEAIHTFYVRAVGVNGPDATPSEFSWEVLFLPLVTILTHPPAQSMNMAPSFTVAADHEDIDYFCQLDANGWVPCEAAPTPNVNTPGNHTFHVKALNRAGEGPETNYSWSTPMLYHQAQSSIPVNTELTYGDPIWVPGGGMIPGHWVYPKWYEVSVQNAQVVFEVPQGLPELIEIDFSGGWTTDGICTKSAGQVQPLGGNKYRATCNLTFDMGYPSFAGFTVHGNVGIDPGTILYQFPSALPNLYYLPGTFG